MIAIEKKLGKTSLFSNIRRDRMGAHDYKRLLLSFLGKILMQFLV